MRSEPTRRTIGPSSAASRSSSAATRVDADRPLLAPRLDRVVVEPRAAGEQEAAVAPGGAAGDRAGVDPDDARARLERRADRGEPGAAEPDDADVGLDHAVERRGFVPCRRIAPHRCRGLVIAAAS